MSQRLSELIDGELSPRELDDLCSGVDRESDLRRIERYQVIGAVLRNENAEATVACCRSRLAERIAARVAEEPESAIADSAPTPSRRRSARTRRQGFWSGFAVAAGLAAVAVFVVPVLEDGPVDDSGLAQSTPGASAVTVEHLEPLLVEHGEYTGSPGLNGLLAYAKFVSAQGGE